MAHTDMQAAIRTDQPVPLSRIYERLRKRAYRAVKREQKMWDAIESAEEPQDLDQRKWAWDLAMTDGTVMTSTDKEHYMRGVNDALNAVETEILGEWRY